MVLENTHSAGIQFKGLSFFQSQACMQKKTKRALCKSFPCGSPRFEFEDVTHCRQKALRPDRDGSFLRTIRRTE